MIASGCLRGLSFGFGNLIHHIYGDVGDSPRNGMSHLTASQGCTSDEEERGNE
jgi:hypothetical protein